MRMRGWRGLDLWNVTKPFGGECYNDGFHFNEIARTHFNELLLRMLSSSSSAQRGGVSSALSALQIEAQ